MRAGHDTGAGAESAMGCIRPPLAGEPWSLQVCWQLPQGIAIITSNASTQARWQFVMHDAAEAPPAGRSASMKAARRRVVGCQYIAGDSTP